MPRICPKCRAVVSSLMRCKCGNYPHSDPSLRCRYCDKHPSKCTCTKELRPAGVSY